MKDVKIQITFDDNKIDIIYGGQTTTETPTTKETTEVYETEIPYEESLTEEIFKRFKLQDAAKSLSEYVDESVDPCDDFYQFTCGTFIKNNPVENIKSLKGPIIGNEKEYFEFINNIFNKEKYSKSPALKKIRKLFRKCFPLDGKHKDSCMNIAFIFGQYFFVSAYLNEMANIEEFEKKYDNVQIMVDQIINEFGLLLLYEKDELLDDKTKQNYLKKIRSMKFFKEHLYYLYNMTNTEECYKAFSIEDRDNVDKIVVNILLAFTSMQNSTNKSGFSCSDFFLQSEFLTIAVDVNAAHFHQKNSIIVFPKFLEEPFYHIYFPESLKFGSIGFIIGHEIIHGFDSNGIFFNHEGAIDGSMTSNDTQKKFSDKRDCFLKQYNNTKKLAIEKVNINQNIADNGGIKIAHRAFIKYLNKIGGEEQKIPGFEKYTSEQLFFISYGRTFCVSAPSELKVSGEVNAVENTLKLRIIKSLSNYQPFSNAFNCNVGRKMNPKDKCELWMH